MRDLQREILNQVASGAMSAQEGAAKLDALESGADTTVEAPPPRAAAPAAARPARQVKVVSQFGSAEIVGDPSVAFAVADGPHSARQEGDTMLIEHQMFDGGDAFSFGHGESRHVVVNGFDVQRRKLIVRMNPELALAVSVQAGSVRIDGVRGPITGEVQAGNLKVSDFRAPLNLVVQAGNVIAGGRLEGGDSRVRCEMGSVRIDLDKSSSVRISARSTLGKVAIEGESADGSPIGSAARSATLGSGSGTLDVDCTMGNVKVAIA
jgi:hypothetical protein